MQLLFVLLLPMAMLPWTHPLDYNETYTDCGREEIEKVTSCEPLEEGIGREDVLGCDRQMCSSWCQDFDFEIKSLEAGVVDFLIKRPPSCCKFNRVDLELIHMKKFNNGSEVQFIQNKLEVVFDDENESSKSLILFTSKYVFPGEYFLKIRPFKDCYNSRLPCHTKKFNIPTTYVPKYLSHSLVLISNQYDSKSSRLFLSVEGDGILEGDLVYVFFSQSQWHCTEDTYYALIYLKDTEIETCTGAFGEKVNKRPCIASKDKVTCTFWNITPGSYYIGVEVKDQRCLSGTMWVSGKDNCRWFDCHMLNGVSPIVMLQYDQRSTLIWLSVAAFCFIFCWGLVIIFIRMKRIPKKTTPVISVVNTQCWKTFSPQLLLLYSWDHPVFMAAMSEFRSYLSNTLGKRVFDLWDPVQFDKVAREAERWILNLLHNPDTKVVVVISSSSLLIEKLLLNGNTISYKQNEFLSTFFPFALNEMMRHSSLRESHARIKLVRFQDGTNPSTSFLTITTPQVYDIPEKLDAFILACYGLPEETVLDNECSKENLLESLKELEDLNSDRLMDIFNL